MVGPHEVNAPHPVQVDPEFGVRRRPASAFTRCRRFRLRGRTDPSRTPTRSGREWKAVTGRTETCHRLSHARPSSDRSALGGPVRESRLTTPSRGPGMTTSYALLSMSSEPTLTDEGVGITLTNRAGHRLPSGEPGRALLVNASFRDASGEELASGRAANRATGEDAQRT